MSERVRVSSRTIILVYEMIW